jgi:hypothetical protein
MPDCTYFSAPDDEAAVAAIETFGPDHAGFDVVFLKNIDPVVAIANLEAIMTGCGYEEARQRPRSGQLLSSPDYEGAFVLSVSDTLVEALVAATQNDIARVAQAWSATDELQPDRVDAAMATDVERQVFGFWHGKRDVPSRSNWSPSQANGSDPLTISGELVRAEVIHGHLGSPCP